MAAQGVFGKRAARAKRFIVWMSADEEQGFHIPHLDTIGLDMIRPDSRLGRFINSPLGKTVLGAGIGGLVVAFANVQDPVVFFAGMALGVVAVFALGQIR